MHNMKKVLNLVKMSKDQYINPLRTATHDYGTL